MVCIPVLKLHSKSLGQCFSSLRPICVDDKDHQNLIKITITYSMDLMLYIILLAGGIQLSKAVDVTTVLGAVNLLCSKLANPPTIIVRDTLVPDSDVPIIVNQVLNYEGHVYIWTGCFFESPESLVDSFATEVSTLTPAYCADECAGHSYFSLFRGGQMAKFRSKILLTRHYREILRLRQSNTVVANFRTRELQCTL